MVDPFTFTIDRTFDPHLLANLRASRVSIVSPDCDVTITRVFSFISGSLYLNSDAISTFTGIFSSFSIMALPTIPACIAVPHATTVMFSRFLNTSSSIPSSVKSGSEFTILGVMVFLRASGCS